MSKNRLATPNRSIANLNNLNICLPTKTVTTADYLLAILYGGCVLKAIDKAALVEMKHLRHC